MTMPPSFKPISKQPIENKSSQVSGMPASFKPISKPQKQKSNEQFMTDEEFERNIDRAQGQIWSRIGETALGAPGDIASFFTGLFGKEQDILPTSSDIREKGKKVFNSAFEPKNEFEKAAGEYVSDVTSMSLPGTGAFKAIRNLGIPVVGALVKQGLKYADTEEKTQAYGKVGTMIALDLISRRTGGAKKYATELYKKAEEALPKGISFDAQNLSKSLDKLEKTLSAGGSRQTTTKALQKVNEIKSEIKNGKIEGKRLAAFRPSINEAIDEIGGFNLEVSRKAKPAAIRNLNQVKKEVINSLDEYASKYNPEYQKFSRDANEAWSAYQQSNKVGNFIQKKIPYSPQSKAVQALFSLGPKAGVASIGLISPVSAIGASAGLLGYQAYKVLDRVVRSPVLRKFYLNTLKQASAGNIPQTTKNIKALDQHLKNEDI